MKWIVLLILIGGCAYAYLFHQDKVMELFGKKGETEDVSKNAPLPSGSKPTDPNKSAPVKPAPPKAPEMDPEIIAKYPMPEFKTIDDLTGNWEQVPSSAFPRTVTLLHEVEMVIAGGAGRSTIPAGTQVTALALAAGELTFTRAPGGSVTTKAPVDSTDFKPVLTEIYNGWVKRKKNQVLQDRKISMRETSIAKAKESGVLSVEGDPDNIDPIVGTKPSQESGGKVPAMIASIEARDVKEIKLDEIDGWGPVRYEIVEGEPYWTGSVRYKTTTLFGVIDTEAMALIRNGKVKQWIYSGSGEEVP
jgi:hypothetical protein